MFLLLFVVEIGTVVYLSGRYETAPLWCFRHRLRGSTVAMLVCGSLQRSSIGCVTMFEPAFCSVGRRDHHQTTFARSS